MIRHFRYQYFSHVSHSKNRHPCKNVYLSMWYFIKNLTLDLYTFYFLSDLPDFHLFCVWITVSVIFTAEDPCQLFYRLFFCQRINVCTRYCILCLFFNQEMLICHRCNLCKMCNTDHLVFFFRSVPSFSDTFCAVRPLIPTSISSKISVSIHLYLPLHFLTASMILESSPPEATSVNGFTCCPWLSEISRNSIINAILGIFFLFRKCISKLHLFKIQVFKTFLDLLFQHVCLLLSKSRKFLRPFKDNPVPTAHRMLSIPAYTHHSFPEFQFFLPASYNTP